MVNRVTRFALVLLEPVVGVTAVIGSYPSAVGAVGALGHSCSVNQHLQHYHQDG